LEWHFRLSLVVNKKAREMRPIAGIAGNKKNPAP
jgi:hypothetical protein